MDQFDTANNGTTVSAQRFAQALRARGNEVRVAAVGAPGEGRYVMEKQQFFKKKDLIIVAVLLIIALALGGFYLLTRDTGAKAQITVNGVKDQVISLSKDGTYHAVQLAGPHRQRGCLIKQRRRARGQNGRGQRLVVGIHKHDFVYRAARHRNGQ